MTGRAKKARAVPVRPWVSAKEAADYLGVCVDTIYDAVHHRGLRHVRIGRGTIRLRLEWIEDWAETQTRQAP